MRKYIKMLLVTAILLTAAKPVACELNVGIGTGSGGSHDAMNLGFDTDIGTSVSFGTSLGGGSAEELPISIVGHFGRFTHSHQVTDGNGDWAKISAKVIDGEDLYYDHLLTPAEGVDSTYALAEQWLDVGQAATIECSQSASDADGNKASAGIKVEDGSLRKYSGYAGAGLGEFGAYWLGGSEQRAEAGQSFAYAEGMKITINEGASDQARAKVTNALLASASENYDGDSPMPVEFYGDYEYGGPAYEGWTGAGDFDWGQSAIAGRYIYDAWGSNIVAKDTASTNIATASTSTGITNGGYWVEPSLEPFTTAAFDDGSTVTGYGIIMASGEKVNLRASASNSPLEDLAYYGGSVVANAILKNGIFFGFNGAGLYEDDSTGELELLAGQMTFYYTDGERVDLKASASSTSGDSDYEYNTVLNPNGLMNMAVAYPENGNVDIIQLYS